MQVPGKHRVSGFQPRIIQIMLGNKLNEFAQTKIMQWHLFQKSIQTQIALGGGETGNELQAE